MIKTLFQASLPVLLLLAFSGCETTSFNGIQDTTGARATMMENIRNEQPGDYWIGRRYYKQDYKFWGYIRRPGQPWSTAQLVMVNEQKKLAPDRAQGKLGSDHNYEYKLYGQISDEPVYEPASNTVYQEFVLSGYELKSISPPPIFRTPAAADPARNVVGRPQ